MQPPVRISAELTLAIHRRQLAEHGGIEGVRDRGLLESALARPKQPFTYGDPRPDLFALAAACSFGIARNHPFSDGNKRTAAVVCETFLELNGIIITADDSAMYPVFLALADGSLPEHELARWLRANTQSA